MERGLICIVLAVLLAGCQTVDGTWRPGCVAFEGDEITFDGAAFSWDRFTDEVKIGADGGVLDPFPDYPRQGSLRRDGDRLELAFGDGSPPRILYLVEQKGALRLLTAEQRADYERTGRFADCAFVRDAAAGG